MVIQMIHRQPFNFYVASCDKEGGIYRLRFEDNALTVLDYTPMDCPMYMIKNNDKMLVLLRAPFEDQNSGIVFYDIAENGELNNPSEVYSTLGECACHLAVNGEDIFCVNYLSGNIFKYPDKTVKHSGKGVHPIRQEAPHTHFVGFTPDEKYICVTDLGLDKIFVYNRDLTINSVTDMPKGHGPRHLAFHKNGQDVFCINELQSTVTHLRYNSGRLTVKNTVESLPDGNQNNIAAAIRCNENKVYVSNRGKNNVAVFSFENDTLTLLKHIPVYGNSPRDFIVDNGLIIATNEKGNVVTVVDEQSGELICSLNIKAPLCVLK